MLIHTVNNRIDFKDLLNVLWEGKLIILVITLSVLSISIGFALTTQEWWSSSAKIAKAQPRNLAAYQQQVKKFQPIFNVYQDDGTVLVSRELNDLIDTNLLFDGFVNKFNSTHNKREFLESNSYFQTFKKSLSLDGGVMTDDDTRAFYSEWFGRMTASTVNSKDLNSPYLVSFQTMTSEGSVDLLTSYILFTESKVHTDAFDNLQAVVSSKYNELVQQKNILEKQAKNKVLVESLKTKSAMAIAQFAGVEKPIQIDNTTELFNINLGSKALEEKVVVLNNIKNLSLIEPRLQKVEAKLDMLAELKIERNIDFQTFNYLENVEQPITKDKPKRALISVLGAFLGGILGVFVVLARFLFRKSS